MKVHTWAAVSRRVFSFNLFIGNNCLILPVSYSAVQ